MTHNAQVTQSYQATLFHVKGFVEGALWSQRCKHMSNQIGVLIEDFFGKQLISTDIFENSVGLIPDKDVCGYKTPVKQFDSTLQHFIAKEVSVFVLKNLNIDGVDGIDEFECVRKVLAKAPLVLASVELSRLEQPILDGFHLLLTIKHNFWALADVVGAENEPVSLKHVLNVLY